MDRANPTDDAEDNLTRPFIFWWKAEQYYENNRWEKLQIGRFDPAEGIQIAACISSKEYDNAIIKNTPC